MFKKLFSLTLCLCLALTFAACGTEEPVAEPPVQTEPVETAPTLLANPLTGVLNLDPAKQNYRPVAVMIDNDSVAQKNAQAGVQAADIVYETEVEGGITRLMAVFADVSLAPQIGDVRSARVQFLELATGHNAIYVHHGRDEEYCGPRMKQLGTDNFVLGTNNCGWRHTYGSATNWQNLYTTGEKLAACLKDSKWKLTADNIPSWQKFTAKSVALTDGTAAKVTVEFNGASTSYFTYNAEKKCYVKTSKSAQNKCVVTGASYDFNNVFVLKTDMSYYPNGKHRKISFNSGSGYYFVNGTYEEIKWKKGDAKDPIVITKADGTALTVQAGNSWVCFASKDSKTKIEPMPEATTDVATQTPKN